MTKICMQRGCKAYFSGNFNLVDNAMKYSPQKSTITIIAKANGNDIEVSVCDEGAGISEKEKNNIFDMFYTVKNTGCRRKTRPWAGTCVV